ncbi:MAG: hypothetical protein JXA54_10375 [Candidatus Heimdallarchaeota archaeon]|nr:hypothetical protein [Candidatus Heimdallarchaeota archaeon]
MKNKLIIKNAMGIIVLTLFVLTSSEMVFSFIPIPIEPVPLTWVSVPADKTVESGTTVTLSWTAKSDYFSKTFVIKKNDVTVKTGTWSSNVAFSYAYKTSGIGKDTIKCYLYDSEQSKIDTCYVTKTTDTDGDGIYDSTEIALGTDPNNYYSPLGQHFELQSAGQNPSGWTVQEQTGYSEVTIVSSCSYTNAKLGKHLRLKQTEDGIGPAISKYVTYGLSSEKLISFEAGYYDPYDNQLNGAYLLILSSTAKFILKIEFQFDRVRIWDTSTTCSNVDLSFNERQMYKYDLILQNDALGYVDYSLYINGKFFDYGTVGKHTAIGDIEFGIYAPSSAEFFLDNIYHGNVEVGNIQYDIPQHQAIPLCWVYAPNVPGVQSHYHVGYSEGLEITVSLSIGINKKVEVKGGIDIVSLYIDLSHDNYGVAVGYGGQDTIVHIRYEYTVSKKSIYLPGSSNIYLDVLIDCNYITTKYYDLHADQFLNEYGWLPVDYSHISITKIGSHTKTYDNQSTNSIEEYYYEKSAKLFSGGGSFSVGKGIFIGATIEYSKEIKANTCLLVDRSIAPLFDYGRPTTYFAYLEVQPYIVQPLGSL